MKGKKLFGLFLIVVLLSTISLMSRTMTNDSLAKCDAMMEDYLFSGAQFFVKNVGQLDPEILYYGDFQQGRIYVRQGDIVFQFIEGEKKDDIEKRTSFRDKFNKSKWERKDGCFDSKDVRILSNVYIKFPEANFRNIVEENEQVTKINIFKGNDPEKWFSEIPTFRTIRIENFYNGVEMILEAGSKEIWRFIANNQKEVDIIPEIPLPLIETSGNVPLIDENIVLSLSIGKYYIPLPKFSDKREKNNIEQKISLAERVSNTEAQQLWWGTYIGGSDYDAARAISLTSSEEVLIVGNTRSYDIPVPNGYDTSLNGDGDIYIAKLSSSGNSLLYASFIGGRGWDSASSLVSDSLGNVVIAGITGSWDIPVLNGYCTSFNGGYFDIYVAKLSPSGNSILWGTYIGGGNREAAEDMSLDSLGNVAIAGFTDSSDIPVPNGCDTSYNGGEADIYVAKLSSSGNSLLWGTYIGGSNDDFFSAISLDSLGNVVIAGVTNSSNIPVPNGYDTSLNDPGRFDIYVAKLSSFGDCLLWGTYIGGWEQDSPTDMVLDSSGNVVIVGSTTSSDIPVPNGYDSSFNGDSDIYVAKLSSSGNSLLWGTYIGGEDPDGSDAVSLDLLGNIIIAGHTASNNIPVPNGYDTSYNSYPGDLSMDIYIAKISSSGNSLLWGTYIGGSKDDYGFAISIDSLGNTIVAGNSFSNDIPVPNRYDTSYNESDLGDIYVAKLSSGETQAPHLSLMQKLGNPFRISVVGSNLKNGIKVFINGSEWTNVSWKSENKIILKGGKSLKSAVPKNTPTNFLFVNPDGGETMVNWQWP